MSISASPTLSGTSHRRAIARANRGNAGTDDIDAGMTHAADRASLGRPVRLGPAGDATDDVIRGGHERLLG
ncbi:hypothetical protein GCM10018966_078240 [Streptomyces yanii]